MLREILLVRPLHLIGRDVGRALDERAEEGVLERREIRVARLMTSSTSRLRSAAHSASNEAACPHRLRRPMLSYASR